MFYHVAAYRQLPVASVPLIVSVPSGNFGNLTAGIFAKRHRLAGSQNTWRPQTPTMSCRNICERGEFHPRAAQATFSNAMDVGNPNNFRDCSTVCRNRPGEYVQKEIWATRNG